MSTFLMDLHYGLRALAANRRLTLICVATLALGIGANTAVFSVVNAVMLRPLAYRDDSRLVLIHEANLREGQNRSPVSGPDFEDWRKQNTVFEDLGAFQRESFTLTGDGEPERLNGASISPGMTELLGVGPLWGRSFVGEDGKSGASQVVLVSENLWQRRFGSDANFLGKTLTLNGQQFRVIGIMPRGFKFPPLVRTAEIWAPIAMDSQRLRDRGGRHLQVLGRLKSGVSLEAARREMSVVTSRLAQDFPATNDGWSANLTSLRESLATSYRFTLLLLLGAVGLVLLIACSNVASLLSARALDRRREIAIRTALGAGIGRILRLLLTENVLLGFLGGASGLILAFWVMRLLTGILPADLPRKEEIGLDYRVLGFALAASLLSGLLISIAPAVYSFSKDLHRFLKEGNPGSGRSRRLGNVIVACEIGISLTLLVVSGLMLQTFWSLIHTEVGFHPEDVLALNVRLPRSKYGERPQREAFYAQVLKRFSLHPGVVAAAMVNPLPLSGSDIKENVIIENRPASGQNPVASYRLISPDYFRAMGIPLLKGRALSEQDVQEKARVVIINQSMWRRYWPNEDPVGKRIKFGNPEGEWSRVVGVVGDVRHGGPAVELGPEVYQPYSQLPPPFATFVVRSLPTSSKLAPQLRSEVSHVDPEQVVDTILPLEKLLFDSVAQPRFQMYLLTSFALLAFALAIAGVYAAMSYSVTQRMREIGLRIALGAETGDITGLIVRKGLLLVVIGLSLGLLASIGATRLIAHQLHGVSALDPVTFGGAALFLGVIALAACYLPARRAARLDPAAILKYE